jgi:hypothetical protein
MPDLRFIGRATELETAARRRCEAAIEEAGRARRAAIDAVHRDLAAGFTKLRDRLADLRLERPRTVAVSQQIADVEALMREWKSSPPQADLAEINAAFDLAAKVADDRLKTEAAEIRRRLRRGEPLDAEVSP